MERSACSILEPSAIFLPCVSLASSEAMPGIRSANKIASHDRSSVAPQGRRPIKQWPLHHDFGTAGEVVESLSIRRIRERVRASKQAAKGRGRQIGAIYHDRSAAKGLPIAIHKAAAVDSHKFTCQDLAIGTYNLNQPGIFAREAIPTA